MKKQSPFETTWIEPHEDTCEAQAIKLEEAADDCLAEGNNSLAERLYGKLLPLQEEAFGLHDPKVSRTIQKLSELRDFQETNARNPSSTYKRVKLPPASGLDTVREYLRDRRKVEIARIKQEQPDISAIAICVELDRRAAYDPDLQPLGRWQRKSHSELWIDNYRYIPTHALVKAWVEEIHPAA